MAEPGWFADPEDASQLRYWDGDEWTDNTAPGTSAPPEAETAPPEPPPEAPEMPATPAAAAAAAAAAIGAGPTTSTWGTQQQEAVPTASAPAAWGSSPAAAPAATPRRARQTTTRRSFNLWPLVLLVVLVGLAAGGYVLLTEEGTDAVPLADVLAVFTDDDVECEAVTPEMTGSELASELRLVPAMLEIPPDQITAQLTRNMMNASAAASKLAEELPADGPYDLVECSGSWIATDGTDAYVAVLGPQASAFAAALEGLGLPVELIE